MVKHVIDTDLYINQIRSGSDLSVLEAIYDRGSLGLYFSSVVAEELWAGVRSDAGKRAIEQLIRPFEKRGRIVTPTHRDWTLAGRILARILFKKPFLRSKIYSLSNDCLIAVSARSIGATVYTRNASDFRLIQQELPLSIVILN